MEKLNAEALAQLVAEQRLSSGQRKTIADALMRAGQVPAKLIHVLDQLPVCTRAYREGLGLSLDAAAVEIGIPTSVLHGFENGSDSRMQTLKSIAAWLEVKQSTQCERPVEITVASMDPAARIAALEAEVAGLTERILRLFQDGGPYRVGRWTREVTHDEPCDCDPDGEWVGDSCMENSPWVYAVFSDEHERLQAILILPRVPPVPASHDPMSPMMALEALEENEELRDQLAAANDVIVGFLGAAAVGQFGTRRAQDVALCGCYIGPGSTGHSCGGA